VTRRIRGFLYPGSAPHWVMQRQCQRRGGRGSPVSPLKTGQCPQWKISVVAMVLEVEHAWKPGCIEVDTVPQAVTLLLVQQVINTALQLRGVRVAGTQHGQHRPGSLAGCTGACAGWRTMGIVGGIA